jgi:hypothetical protein
MNYSRQFEKQLSCPSSDALLGYARSSISLASSRVVELHLADCDFCGAELQLLSKHIPIEESASPSKPSLLTFVSAAFIRRSMTSTQRAA